MNNSNQNHKIGDTIVNEIGETLQLEAYWKPVHSFPKEVDIVETATLNKIPILQFIKDTEKDFPLNSIIIYQNSLCVLSTKWKTISISLFGTQFPV